MIRRPPRSTLFPTRRSSDLLGSGARDPGEDRHQQRRPAGSGPKRRDVLVDADLLQDRSEEHTSELQSLTNLACRLLLDKKKKHSILRLNHNLPFTANLITQD